jgi:hypothetical protein
MELWIKKVLYRSAVICNRLIVALSLTLITPLRPETFRSANHQMWLALSAQHLEQAQGAQDNL